ncbi:MAG: SDR family NAD(P)-dependent oxidoreductase [Dehalococcoidia bacterium]|nr:SDR family NAD(P)-dependent oxidoreductase [Dehalococcoidia bacterium]
MIGPMTTPADLGGRCALVMGAGQPVAAAIAMGLAEAGADVAITSATADAEEAFELRRLAKRISATGQRSSIESVDMSIATSVQVAVRKVAKELGRIDLLVVAADLRPEQRPAERISDADWARVIGHNLSAMFYACRSVAREMLRQEPAPDTHRGQIIVLTVPAETFEAGTDAAYVAAKAGAAALVTALSREWQPHRINVAAIEVSFTAEVGDAAAAVLRLAGRSA